jgi:hypothetical protein
MTWRDSKLNTEDGLTTPEMAGYPAEGPTPGSSGGVAAIGSDRPAAPVEMPAPAMPSGWRLALVVTASALCGGIAVVLWNRRLLTKMREVAPMTGSDEQDRLWEDDL